MQIYANGLNFETGIFRLEPGYGHSFMTLFKSSKIDGKTTPLSCQVLQSLSENPREKTHYITLQKGSEMFGPWRGSYKVPNLKQLQLNPPKELISRPVLKVGLKSPSY